jgi:hypothetical protein
MAPSKRKATADDTTTTTTTTMPDAKKTKKATRASRASGGADNLKGAFPFPFYFHDDVVGVMLHQGWGSLRMLA